MSYEIVKSIGIHEGKCFITSSSNNVYPHTFSKWECTPLTKIFQEQGKEAWEKAVLLDYWEGNMQGTRNNFDNANQDFRRKFPQYNWDYPNKDEVVQKLYEHYLKFKNREKFECVIKSTEREDYFVYKVSKRSLSLIQSIDRARHYKSIEDAENSIRYFDRKKYEIVPLKAILTA